MNLCTVCHQKELSPQALEKGEGILAKGQLICTPCAEQFGIRPDSPALLPRQVRSATEEMPLPPAPARPSPVPTVAVLLSCLAAGAAAWALWIQQDLKARVSSFRQEVPPVAPTRDPALAEAVKVLDRKLAETERALAEMKERQANGNKELAGLVAELKEEARKAREQSAAAREAAEGAAARASAEFSAAVAKALAEKGEAAPKAGGKPPAGPDVLAEQYWELAQNRAKVLAQRGRLSQAIKEYEAIPIRHRIPGYDQRVADFRETCERQALERADLVLKSLDARLAANEYAEAEALLAQVLEECAFEGVQKKLEPKLEEVRTLMRGQVRQDQEESRRAKTLLVAGLLDDLSKPDEKARQRAVDALRTLGPDGVEPMTRALDRPEPAVRWGILMALGGIRSTDAVPAIARCLKDPDRKVRLMAADVLSEFDDTRAAPDLIEALGDADPAVADQAETTLEKITHHASAGDVGARPADRAVSWRAWWESGRKNATGR